MLPSVSQKQISITSEIIFQLTRWRLRPFSSRVLFVYAFYATVSAFGEVQCHTLLLLCDPIKSASLYSHELSCFQQLKLYLVLVVVGITNKQTQADLGEEYVTHPSFYAVLTRG